MSSFGAGQRFPSLSIPTVGYKESPGVWGGRELAQMPQLDRCPSPASRVLYLGSREQLRAAEAEPSLQHFWFLQEVFLWPQGTLIGPVEMFPQQKWRLALKALYRLSLMESPPGSHNSPIPHCPPQGQWARKLKRPKATPTNAPTAWLGHSGEQCPSILGYSPWMPSQG